MRNLPRRKGPQISFCLSHVARWAELADELGLDPAAVAELQDRAEAARLAFNAQRQAQIAARSATSTLNIALEEMTTLAAALISQIRATAATTTTGGDGVYSKAWIRVPQKRSKIGRPGKPTAFTAQLQPVGWLELRWKCDNPRGSVGTMYHIHRQTQSADGTWSEKTPVGIAGTRRFTDATLPPGCCAVQYHVQAVRSTAVGDTANYTVNFGTTFRANAPGHMQLAA